MDCTICVAGHRVNLDGLRARALYVWLITRLEELEIVPDIVTLDAPGFWGVKYKSFNKTRQRIAGFDFSNFRSLRLTRRGANWSDRAQDNWITTASIVCNHEKPVFNRIQWCISVAESGLSSDAANHELTQFAKVGFDHYGYLFRMARLHGPQSHITGCSGLEPFSIKDEKENAAWWGLYQDLIPSQLMLRDIYPVNFLSNELLQLPVQRKTLSRWIREKESRGHLERLTEAMWKWTPPPARIQAIREQLFRAGILFYYRFFQYWEPDNVWKRDFSKPFVPHEPIPTIFRADYPRITDL